MSTSPKSVWEHPIFSRQEGWGQSSCDKLKKIEQVDPLSTLQDGRFTLSKVYVATRGLHIQIRHEGHSTRSASTSKAEMSGLSVKEILDRGYWSNEST